MSIRTTVLAIAMLGIPGFTLGETPPVHPEGALRVANPQFTQGSAAQIRLRQPSGPRAVAGSG